MLNAKTPFFLRTPSSRVAFKQVASKHDPMNNVPVPLKGKSDRYPAMPEDVVRLWEENCSSERMWPTLLIKDFRLENPKIASFSQMFYGPGRNLANGGARESSCSNLSRKSPFHAKSTGNLQIEILGGWATKLESFTYIDDCLHGIRFNRS